MPGNIIGNQSTAIRGEGDMVDALILISTASSDAVSVVSTDLHAPICAR